MYGCTGILKLGQVVLLYKMANIDEKKMTLKIDAFLLKKMTG